MIVLKDVNRNDLTFFKIFPLFSMADGKLGAFTEFTPTKSVEQCFLNKNYGKQQNFSLLCDEQKELMLMVHRQDFATTQCR